jgi:hypothetical protein
MQGMRNGMRILKTGGRPSICGCSDTVAPLEEGIMHGMKNGGGVR